jgi:hypothetical protein
MVTAIRALVEKMTLESSVKPSGVVPTGWSKSLQCSNFRAEKEASKALSSLIPSYLKVIGTLEAKA